MFLKWLLPDILWLLAFTLVFTSLVSVGVFMLYKKHAPKGWCFKTGSCYAVIILTTLFISLPCFGLIRAKSYTYKAQNACETFLVGHINAIPEVQVGKLSTRLMTGSNLTDPLLLLLLESGNKALDFKPIIVKEYPLLERFVPEITIDKVLKTMGVDAKEVTSMEYLVKLISRYCFSFVHDFINGFIVKLLFCYFLFAGLPAYFMYRDIKKKKALLQESVDDENENNVI